jgi:hypothetical protein
MENRVESSQQPLNLFTYANKTFIKTETELSEKFIIIDRNNALIFAENNT